MYVPGYEYNNYLVSMKYLLDMNPVLIGYVPGYEYGKYLVSTRNVPDKNPVLIEHE